MKIFWADREGNPAPSDATFHFYPFLGHGVQSTQEQQRELPPPIRVKVMKQKYFPSREVWIQNVEKALKLIQKKELQKVVLARCCTLELDHAPDPFALTAALRERAEGAFVFCLQRKTDAFLGASPERLYVRRKQTIITEAIAGTRSRGQNLAEDQKWQKELMKSAKDLRELSPVQSYLQTVLTPLCKGTPLLTPIAIHQTKNVHHLYGKCLGELKFPLPDEQIISQMHPTPALCGTPKQKAIELIQELEPFSRGLYGGVLGWTNSENAEWIVGIRSCLLRGNIATLFSGTGIVEGSNPEEEWEELEQKLRIYDGILDR